MRHCEQSRARLLLVSQSTPLQLSSGRSIKRAPSSVRKILLVKLLPCGNMFRKAK